MTPATVGFVHEFIPASAPDAPTLLLLHGTGGNERDLLGLGRVLSPQSALLSPRGQVLEQGMPRFFRRLAEGVFDTEDLIRRTGHLASFVSQSAAAYGFDPGHVIAAGFSNGANIATSLLLLHPNVLSGAILFAPMVPLEPNLLPTLSGVPVFLGAGRNDPLVPVSQTERLAQILRVCGAEVAIGWHASGHALTPEIAGTAAAWLQRQDLF